MYNPDDHGYFAGRSLEEMERGDGAADPSVAAIHYELAHRYAKLAARPGTEPPKLTLIQGGSDIQPRRSSGQTDRHRTVPVHKPAADDGKAGNKCDMLGNEAAL